MHRSLLLSIPYCCYQTNAIPSANTFSAQYFHLLLILFVACSSFVWIKQLASCVDGWLVLFDAISSNQTQRWNLHFSAIAGFFFSTGKTGLPQFGILHLICILQNKLYLYVLCVCAVFCRYLFDIVYPRLKNLFDIENFIKSHWKCMVNVCSLNIYQSHTHTHNCYVRK